jgi:hypothetical protein
MPHLSNTPATYQNTVNRIKSNIKKKWHDAVSTYDTNTEHDSFIEQKACIRRDMPWELQCWAHRQKKHSV